MLRHEHLLLEQLSMLCGKTTMHQGVRFAHEILQIYTFIMNIGRIAAAASQRENARKHAPIRLIFHASHMFLMSTTNSIHPQRPFCDKCRRRIKEGFGVDCKNASSCFCGRCTECIDNEGLSLEYSQNPNWQCKSCEVLCRSKICSVRIVVVNLSACTSTKSR